MLIGDSIKKKGFLKTLADAAMTAFSSAAKIPVVGPLLGAAAAAAAVGLGMKLFNVGDARIDPNGGPAVYSPRENALFQGTKNDGVSMSPQHGGPDTGGGLGNIAKTLFAMSPMGMAANALGGLFGGGKDKDDSVSMQDVVDALGNITINIDGKALAAELRVADSFRRG